MLCPFNFLMYRVTVRLYFNLFKHKIISWNSLTVLCWNFYGHFRFVMIAVLWKVGRYDALDFNRGNIT